MIGMRKEDVRAIHLHTHKIRVSKLKTYKIFAYAITYLKMFPTAQNCNMANRQYVKYNLRFYFCFCFSKKPSSPSTKPPTTLPFLLAISFSYSDNTIKATQHRYVRQYSTVSNCKGNNFICNMTVFCDEEETNTFEVPNE